jgi:methyl-accepting chemotaxis protein
MGLSRLLHQLAVRLLEQTERQLVGNVDLSIHTNTTVLAATDMVQHLTHIHRAISGIAAAVEELQASTHQISQNSLQSMREAVRVQSILEDLSHDSGPLMEAITKIEGAFTEANSHLKTLGEASASIGEMMDNIRDVAAATKMLAVNASIEAARAGEAGKGFAVVANEVQKLATQVDDAANDADERVKLLVEETDKIVRSIDAVATIVQAENQTVLKTIEDMTSVKQGIQIVSSAIQDITEVLRQQEESTELITNNVTDTVSRSEVSVQLNHQVLDVMDQNVTLISELIEDIGHYEFPTRDLLRAKVDHMIWRKKLADMLVGRASLPSSELKDHHSCRLGKWYHGVQAPQIRQHSAFVAIEQPHRMVHEFGIAAAKAYEQREFERAQQLVRDIEQPSIEVQRLLDELIVHVRGV